MVKIGYYGHFEDPTNCENWIADGLNRNGAECHRIERGNISWQQLLQMRLVGFDVLLFSKIPDVKPEEFRRLKRKTRARLVFWTFDWMMHHSNAWYQELAPIADLCFQTDGHSPKELEAYEKAGVRRVELHQAADQQHDLPKTFFLDDMALSFDILFIGRLYTQRRKDLHERLSQIAIRHNASYGKFGHPQAELWGSDFAKACYLSKIVVCDNFVNNVPGYWSDRLYLSLGCGAFVLASHVPDIERVFTDHVHLVVWKDFGHLERLIEKYLDDTGFRRAVALNGYRLVRNHHTYDQRAQRFLAELRKL